MSEPTHKGNTNEDALTLSQTAREWVIALASGEMEANQLRQFKTWLAEHPSHQAAFDRERAFWQQLEDVAESASWEQEGEGRRVHQAVDRSRARRWSRRPVMISGLVAACLALVVLYQDIRMFALADYHTSVGEQHRVTLPDGGLAYLNTDTAVRVTYAEDERRVDLLEGEAFFEVMPNQRQPFRVVSHNGVTQAVGTAFVVRAHEEDTTVTVTEGAVAVFSGTTGSRQPASPVAVRQGQQTVYRQGKAPERAVTVDDESATAWTTGKIVIEDQPFAQAMAELDRYRPGQIVLLADLSETKPVSGRFRLDGVDEAITALAATQGLAVMRVTDYLVFIL